jgi:hypothetical protein
MVSLDGLGYLSPLSRSTDLRRVPQIQIVPHRATPHVPSPLLFPLLRMTAPANPLHAVPQCAMEESPTQYPLVAVGMSANTPPNSSSDRWHSLQSHTTLRGLSPLFLLLCYNRHGVPNDSTLHDIIPRHDLIP